MDFSVCKLMVFVHIAFRYGRISTDLVSILLLLQTIFDFFASLGDAGTRPRIAYPTRVHKYSYIEKPNLK